MRALFGDELRAALDQIRTAPLLGSAYAVVGGQEHRRVLMRTRYHYRIAAADSIRIVAVWSAVGPANVFWPPDARCRAGRHS